ncbi:MAG: hypothetical protein LLF94_10630 [Chlamydiales bacterium]|nr:hypothetical protein [Chlamydiales bacterium]
MEMNLATMNLALDTLGQLLGDRNLHYECVACGSASMLLLGLSLKSAKEVCVLAMVESNEFIKANPLPEELERAVQDISQAVRLKSSWIQPVLGDLFDGLPDGFKRRMHMRQHGSLTLYLTSRLDQIYLSLFQAVCDGPISQHYSDLKTLKPTTKELQDAAAWCLKRDPSPEFAKTLNDALATFI